MRKIMTPQGRPVGVGSRFVQVRAGLLMLGTGRLVNRLCEKFRDAVRMRAVCERGSLTFRRHHIE